MKTPWWFLRKTPLSFVLWPLSVVYYMASRLVYGVRKIGAYKSRRPVVCVGNIFAGGVGKTPIVREIALHLGAPVVMRGYKKGAKTGNIGDEALMLSRHGIQVHTGDRKSNIVLLNAQNDASPIVMDDGFQNPGLHKDLSFLVFDGGFGYGNGLCIPAGPLRESLPAGMKRADAILIIGEDRHRLAEQIALPVFRGQIVPVRPNFSERRVIAFAGIGRPEKFYQSLRELNFELVETVNFPDHHFYTDTELDQLIDKAEKNSCTLITTAKDLVKIPSRRRSFFKVLEIEVRWEDEDALAGFILHRLP